MHVHDKIAYENINKLPNIKSCKNLVIEMAMLIARDPPIKEPSFEQCPVAPCYTPKGRQQDKARIRTAGNLYICSDQTVRSVVSCVKW